MSIDLFRLRDLIMKDKLFEGKYKTYEEIDDIGEKLTFYLIDDNIIEYGSLSSIKIIQVNDEIKVSVEIVPDEMVGMGRDLVYKVNRLLGVVNFHINSLLDENMIKVVKIYNLYSNHPFGRVSSVRDVFLFKDTENNRKLLLKDYSDEGIDYSTYKDYIEGYSNDTIIKLNENKIGYATSIKIVICGSKVDTINDTRIRCEAEVQELDELNELRYR